MYYHVIGARTSWSQFGLPIVPPQVQVKDSRKKLPTWSKMEEITTLIRNNKVGRFIFTIFKDA